jgi:hypothetical protein
VGGTPPAQLPAGDAAVTTNAGGAFALTPGDRTGSGVERRTVCRSAG